MTSSGDNENRSGDVKETIRLLESSDIQVAEEAASVLREQLISSGECLCALLEHFVATQSTRAIELIRVRDAFDRIFLDKLCDNLKSRPLETLTLFIHVIHKQPSWLPKLPQHPFFGTFIKFMKHTAETSHVITGLFLLAALLPQMPLMAAQPLSELFQVFFRGAEMLFQQTKPQSTENPVKKTDLQLIYTAHLHLALESYFQRLYSVYPCNFLTNMRQQFAGNLSGEKRDFFQEVMRPLLCKVRTHPMLVTATKDYEFTKERWYKKEAHDIFVECSKIAIDDYQEVNSNGNLVSQQQLRNFLLLPKSDFGEQGRPLSTTSLTSSRCSLLTVGGQPSTRTTPMKSSIATTESGIGLTSSPGEKSDISREKVKFAPIGLPAAAPVVSKEDDVSEGRNTADTKAVCNLEGKFRSVSGDVESGHKTLSLNIPSAEVWSPSMIVGLETPPESRSVTPVVRRESFKLIGPADQRGSFGSRRSTGESYRPRRSFGQAWSKFFRTTSDKDMILTGTAKDKLKSQTGSVPPSPMKFEAGQQQSFRYSLAESTSSGSGLGAPSAPNERLVGPSAVKQPVIGPVLEETVIAAHSRQGSQASQAEVAEEAEESPPIQEVEKEEYSEATETTQPHVTLSQLESVAKKLSDTSATAVTAEDTEVKRLLAKDDSAESAEDVVVRPARVGRETGREPSATPPSAAAVVHHATFEDAEEPPRFLSSESVNDFFKKHNRYRFKSECAPGATELEDADSEDMKDIEDDDGDVEELTEMRPPAVRKRSLSCPQKLRKPVIERVKMGKKDLKEKFDGATTDIDRKWNRILLGNEKASTLPKRKKPAVDRKDSGQESMHSSGNLSAREHDVELQRQWTRQLQKTYPYLPILPLALPSSRINAPRPEDMVKGDEASAISQVSSQGATVTNAGDAMQRHLMDDYLQASKKFLETQLALGFTDWSHFSTPPTSEPLIGDRKDSVGKEGKDKSQALSAKDAGALRAQMEALRAHLALCQQQVMYEKYRRMVFSTRSRKLYGRLKMQVAMEEEASESKEKIYSQEMEIERLIHALTEFRKEKNELKENYSAKEYSQSRQLQLKIKENETLSQKVEVLRRELDNFAKENVKLRAEVAAIKNEQFHNESEMKFMEKKADQVEGLKSHIESLENQLFAATELHMQSKVVLQETKKDKSIIHALEEKLKMQSAACKKEVSDVKRQVRKERNKAEGAAQKALDLEVQLHKHLQQIAEMKSQQETAHQIHKQHLTAVDQKYKSVLAVCQRQETHIADLYRVIEELTSAMTMKSKGGIAGTDRDRGVAIPDRQEPKEIASYGSSFGGGASSGASQRSGLCLTRLFAKEKLAETEERENLTEYG